MLSEDGHRRIVAAIKAIDEQSDGEIYCLIAQESSHYREVPLAWAAIAALLVPPFGLALGLDPETLVRLTGGWSAGQATLISHEVYWALSVHAMGQALLFAIVALMVAIPAIRRVMTPRFLKRHRVRRLAGQHFVSTGIHLSAGQPHILIYISLAERQVEILAAEAIHTLEGQALWDRASATLIAGMKENDPASAIVQAIEMLGAPLIARFPATAAHPNVTANGVGEV